MSLVSTVSTIRIQTEGFSSGIRTVDNPNAEFSSTIRIQMEGFSSGIRNVLLKSVSTVSTIRIQMEGFSSGIRNVLLKSVSTVSTIRMLSFHPNEPCIDSVDNPDSDRRLFIRYSKCSTQICIDSVDNPNAEFSHLIEPQTPVSTVSTNIALNALHALIFVSTVSTNKIPYSFELQCRS